jgi:RecA/RadA recombinase
LKKSNDDGPNTLEMITKQLNTRYGEKSCILGTDARMDPPRLPSGIFALDYAIGGGFPLNQITVVQGPEHGGKTSLAKNALGMVGKICWRCMNLLDKCTCSLPSIRMRGYWSDIEGTFNRMWAESLGCDSSTFYIDCSDDGNQAGDMLEYALRADDCGLVVLDSVGSLLSSAEVDGSLQDTFIGKQSKLAGDLAKRITQRLRNEAKRGHPCIAIFLNQIRAVIGQMYGNPETGAGGYGIKHHAALRIRIAKRSMGSDSKYTDKDRGIVTAQKHAFGLEKFKNLRLCDSGEFIRATEDIPDKGIRKGMIIDHKLVFQYAKDFNVMDEESSNHFKIGDFVGNKNEIITYWMENPIEYLAAQKTIIDAAKVKLCNAEIGV